MINAASIEEKMPGMPEGMNVMIETHEDIGIFRKNAAPYLDPAWMRSGQQAHPLNYTESLHMSRADWFDDLSASLGNHLGTLLKKGARVAEFGPGVERSLYSLMSPYSTAVKAWYGMDINKGIVDSLKADAKGTNFRPLFGAAHERHSEIRKASIDMALFMCSHDSMMEFEDIADNVRFYLKAGGFVGLIQDHFPSSATIYSLIASDDRFAPGVPVSLIYYVQEEKDTGRKSAPLAFVGIPVYNDNCVERTYFMDSRHYLNTRVAESFMQNGFRQLDQGFYHLDDRRCNHSDVSLAICKYGWGKNVTVDLQSGMNYAFALLQKKEQPRRFYLF